MLGIGTGKRTVSELEESVFIAELTLTYALNWVRGPVEEGFYKRKDLMWLFNVKALDFYKNGIV